MLDKSRCGEFNDQELAVKALTDPDFYYCIVERFEEPLKRYINRLTNLSDEEVEDLLQEVFLKVYLNLNAFDSKLKFSSWLYRITHNEVISNFRKRSARRIDQQESLDDWQELASTFSQEVDFDEKLTAKQVKTVLTKLDAKYREALVLRFLEDKNYEEISDILQKPLGTVSTLINRAKKQFKEVSKKQKLSF